MKYLFLILAISSLIQMTILDFKGLDTTKQYIAFYSNVIVFWILETRK